MQHRPVHRRDAAPAAPTSSVQPLVANLRRRDAASGETAPAESVQELMVADVLEKLMAAVTTAVIEPHHPSSERQFAMNKARRIEMRSEEFRTTLKCLEPAYSKLLYEAFENQWDSESAAKVRGLADTVLHKLYAKLDMDSAEEGEHLMHAMLEHLRVEFKWARMLAILESAAETAREQKAKAYEDARSCQTDLRDIRHNGKTKTISNDEEANRDPEGEVNPVIVFSKPYDQRCATASWHNPRSVRRRYR